MEEKNASMFTTVPSPMSKYQKFYQAANKTRIYNKGQKDIKAVTGNGTSVDITFQIADQVTQPLGSVRRLCEAGNRVVFDNDGSYVQDKKNGEKTEIRREKGAYVMDFWVRKGDSNGVSIGDQGFLGLEDSDI